MRRMLALVLLAVSLVAVPVHAASQMISAGADTGTVVVSYESTAKVKVEVSKDGTSYYYDLTGTEAFPLQMGNGTYRVSVLENVQDNRYKVVRRENILVETTSDNAPYLSSVQNVKWTDEDAAITKATELSDAKDQLAAIYSYLVSNVKYDYNKIHSLAPGYLPNIEDTFASGRGICYDFAALFASMLRSQGIPTKLVMGYTPNAVGYHAWNEVFVDGKWIVIDITYDSQMKEKGLPYSMIKTTSTYQVTKVY